MGLGDSPAGRQSRDATVDCRPAVWPLFAANPRLNDDEIRTSRAVGRRRIAGRATRARCRRYRPLRKAGRLASPTSSSTCRLRSIFRLKERSRISISRCQPTSNRTCGCRRRKPVTGDASHVHHVIVSVVPPADRIRKARSVLQINNRSCSQGSRRHGRAPRGAARTSGLIEQDAGRRTSSRRDAVGQQGAWRRAAAVCGRQRAGWFPPDPSILFQMHYQANGTPGTDRLARRVDLLQDATHSGGVPDRRHQQSVRPAALAWTITSLRPKAPSPRT